MARIIGDIDPTEDTVYNYNTQAFCFNDSDAWLIYGREINYSMLRKNLRDLARTYDIRKITIRPFEASINVEYYIRYAKGESSRFRMLIALPKDAREHKPIYGELKPVHKRTLLSDPTVFEKTNELEIAQRKEKAQNRKVILNDARKIKTKEIDMSTTEWKEVKSFIKIAKTGRRPMYDDAIVNALRWTLITGGLWKDIPKRYGSFRTIFNR